MPNRKTFDDREKYDHSGHPLGHRQPSDLQADIQDKEDEVAKVTRTDNAKPSKPRIIKRRNKSSA
jgi:hypothetical protein